jgi:lysozyme family protein
MTKQIKRIYRSAESGYLVAYDSSQPPGLQIRIAWHDSLILRTSVDNARALQQLLSDVLALLDSEQSQSADSMTNTRKADASDWAWLEGHSTVNRFDAAWSRGLIELRARVEALEAQQLPAPVKESLTTQPGGLVERVAKICAREWDGNPEMWGGVAEAVIRAVAAWFTTITPLDYEAWRLAAELLEQEVDRD